jgi:hypothetical protein|tara:strand:+ start:1999 stop:2355 length:357 start_codon:yes stop_codon:yes gene_type:complete
MTDIIYANENHKLTVNAYLSLCKEFAKDVSTKSKYNSYLDILETIIQYHNGYGEGVRENNFYDWIMILPINLSVMTNGFFAGLETKSNSAIIRSYRLVLEQMVQDTVNKLDVLEPTNE